MKKTDSSKPFFESADGQKYTLKEYDDAVAVFCEELLSDEGFFELVDSIEDDLRSNGLVQRAAGLENEPDLNWAVFNTPDFWSEIGQKQTDVFSSLYLIVTIEPYDEEMPEIIDNSTSEWEELGDFIEEEFLGRMEQYLSPESYKEFKRLELGESFQRTIQLGTKHLWNL